MAGYVSNIRGDGLFTAHAALHALAEDPQQLERNRVRFEHSPPPYNSDLSGTTTRSPSPILLSDEQRNRRERRDELSVERSASTPSDQFRQQRREEKERVLEAHENRTQLVPIGHSFDTVAYNNVKQRWNEQGLWSDKWTMYALGRWKHEEPFEPVSESESETETDAPPAPALFHGPRAKPRRRKSEEKKRRETEIRRCDREASRPYHQFVYQVSKERERLQNESTGEEGSYTDDVNTQAYNIILALWRKRKIWNEKWGVLPGMSWKHEQPWEEALSEHGLQDSPINTEARVPPSNGSPTIGLSQRSASSHPHGNSLVNDFSSLQSNSVVTPSPLNAGQKQSRDVDATLLSANAQGSDTALTSPQPESSNPARRATRSTMKNSNSNDDQLHVLARVPQGSVSKISKSTVKRKPVRKSQSEVVQELRQCVSASPCHNEVITGTPKHRLARGQTSRTISNGHAKQDNSRQQRRIGTDDARSRPSAKPQGIVKRRSPRISAVKARKFGT